MKMRHLKTFENFDPTDSHSRFSGSDSDEQEWLTHIKPKETGLDNEFEEECPECGDESGCPSCKPEDEEETPRKKVWGDEVVEEPIKLERKKFNFEKKKDDRKMTKRLKRRV